MNATALNVTSAANRCQHCGSDVPDGAAYCCLGCAAAHQLIFDLGLSDYYRTRKVGPENTRLRPGTADVIGDLTPWETDLGDSRAQLVLLVDGLQCGACVWLIEQTLRRQKGVVSATLSLSTSRLTIVYRKSDCTGRDLVGLVQALGYHLIPYDASALDSSDKRELASLLRSLAVAGFAAGNLMLLSISVWAGEDDMAASTRNLFHWVSALIAIPAIAYAGRPFFLSAISALRAGRTNMDVPISLAIILAPAISLYQTFSGGRDAYFDSAATLLFFLLVGRFLDRRARRLARSAVEQLLLLQETPATIINDQGCHQSVPAKSLQVGQIILVQPGTRLSADATVITGTSQLDTSLITGESLPIAAAVGTSLCAGTLNITAPLTARIDRVGDQTLLADITKLMEAAETRRLGFVQFADKVARYYAPVIHTLALATFLGWLFFLGASWPNALLTAVSVLIITCPCALALAVPVVQVVASRRLLQSGILLKSGDALERLASIDHVIIDKTGTLTVGQIDLLPGYDAKALRIAASIAANSRHPLSLALLRAAGPVLPATGVIEVPGNGLEWHAPDGLWLLGSADFTQQLDDHSSNHMLYLLDPHGQAYRFDLRDQLREDAGAVLDSLHSIGPIEICSGDRVAPVQHVAEALGIGKWHAAFTPADKVAYLEKLRRDGRHVLMIGDGLNDAAALSAAYVSMAPATAADISQRAADLVFQGNKLQPVLLAIKMARRSNWLMKENLFLALAYNLAAVPLAMAGLVTPLIAALAMSSSSILVVMNALRLSRAFRSGAR